MTRTWIGLLMLFFLPVNFDEKRETRTPASAWTMIPSQSLAGLHYVFKGFDYGEDNGFVTVTGPVIEITQGKEGGSKIYPNGFTLEMEVEALEEEQGLGQAVFQARSGNGKTVGTAFLVGKDLVLTNRHIMNIAQTERENWSCGQFSVILNHKEEIVNCAKVRFCSGKHDYCVVELSKMQNGLSVGIEVRPLRLARTVKAGRDVSLLHIGNAGGLGLQASRGAGLRVEGGEFHHFVPTLNGSSGAPLFDEKGQVIGLNWGHTGKDYVDDASFNRGVLSVTIYNELARTHRWTLNEIKSFKAWHQREFRHRDVKVLTAEE